MNILSQIGDKRIKYPAINSQETALKFIAISLKACNPNQNAFYRKKYKAQLRLFSKDCELSREFKELSAQRETMRNVKSWSAEEEEHYLQTAESFFNFRQTM